MTRPGMVYDEWLAPNTYQWHDIPGDILYTGSSHTKPHTSGDMINTITALNGADGSVRWKANLSDSTMYRGMNHQVVNFDRGYESSDDILLVWNDWTTGDLSANKVYAIHTGKEVWSLTTGDMLPPVVDQCSASSSTLITYIASSTCHRCGKLGSNPSLKLFALDQKGTVIWTFAPKPNETLIV
jgi:outer membrane protein assembly factor BamB